MRFALTQTTGEGGQQPPVFVMRNGRLHAQNYVGIIETRRGTVIEILPKIDLSRDGDEHTRRVFMTMLRDWRGLGQARLDGASIRAIRRFDMFEAFVHLFLTSVVLLTRRGLARAYRTREANLPQLRGRILFPRHVRENLVDRSRFYVGYDEFTANRPANRLIHLALRRLTAGRCVIPRTGSGFTSCASCSPTSPLRRTSTTTGRGIEWTVRCGTTTP